MSKTFLTEEIKEFQRQKKWLVPILVSLGVLGLVLPILPGVALLLFGLFLLFPTQGEDIVRRIRQALKL